MFVAVPLVKANHMEKPKVIGRGVNRSIDRGKCHSLGIFLAPFTKHVLSYWIFCILDPNICFDCSFVWCANIYLGHILIWWKLGSYWFCFCNAISVTTFDFNTFLYCRNIISKCPQETDRQHNWVRPAWWKYIQIYRVVNLKAKNVLSKGCCLYSHVISGCGPCTSRSPCFTGKKGNLSFNVKSPDF